MRIRGGVLTNTINPLSVYGSVPSNQDEYVAVVDSVRTNPDLLAELNAELDERTSTKKRLRLYGTAAIPVLALVASYGLVAVGAVSLVPMLPVMFIALAGSLVANWFMARSEGYTRNLMAVCHDAESGIVEKRRFDRLQAAHGDRKTDLKASLFTGAMTFPVMLFLTGKLLLSGGFAVAGFTGLMALSEGRRVGNQTGAEKAFRRITRAAAPRFKLEHS